MSAIRSSPSSSGSRSCRASAIGSPSGRAARPFCICGARRSAGAATTSDLRPPGSYLWERFREVGALGRFPRACDEDEVRRLMARQIADNERPAGPRA